MPCATAELSSKTPKFLECNRTPHVPPGRGPGVASNAAICGVGPPCREGLGRSFPSQGLFFGWLPNQPSRVINTIHVAVLGGIFLSIVKCDSKEGVPGNQDWKNDSAGAGLAQVSLGLYIVSRSPKFEATSMWRLAVVSLQQRVRQTC